MSADGIMEYTNFKHNQGQGFGFGVLQKRYDAMLSQQTNACFFCSKETLVKGVTYAQS